MIDQLTNAPGNLRRLADHFTDPPRRRSGCGAGAELLARAPRPLAAARPGDRLADPGRLALAVDRRRAGRARPGRRGRSAAVVAWRLRHGALVRLHAVLAVGLVLGWSSISRIFGFVWYYLSLWAWGLAVLMFVASGGRWPSLLRRRVAPVQGTGGPVRWAWWGCSSWPPVSFTVDATDAAAATNSNLRLVHGRSWPRRPSRRSSPARSPVAGRTGATS